jgi:hypothetical protein
MTLTRATCVRRKIAALEAALMKLLGAIGISGLLLLIGSTTAAYAPQEQSDKPEKQEEKAKPEKQEPQDKPAKQAKQEPQDKPAKQTKQEPQDKPAKQDAKQAKQEPQDKPAQQLNQKSAQQSRPDGTTSGSGDHGRISDDHYRASFGSGHNFHVNRGDYDHRRFDYGGYSFGFIDPWPVGWGYTDNVYVVYDDGAYYMYDVVHPGVRISVSIL